jgi:hypothetical protein
MRSINVNAIISCKAAFCQAQVIGSYCKKIYRGFSGEIVTSWHKVQPYETVTMLPPIECIVRFESTCSLLNTSDNVN